MSFTMLFSRLAGTEGHVSVKGLGSRAGELAQWDIRRQDNPDGSQTLRLRAVFTYVIPQVLLDPDYNEGRELVCRVSKTKAVLVKLDNPERMALTGKVLEIEGVEPRWVSE